MDGTWLTESCVSRPDGCQAAGPDVDPARTGQGITNFRRIEQSGIDMHITYRPIETSVQISNYDSESVHKVPPGFDFYFVCVGDTVKYQLEYCTRRMIIII